MPVCPICNCEEFKSAPFNRLSRKGLPPVCANCRSLERHRIGRAIVTKLRDREKFVEYRLLQLSNDPIVARGWFASVEYSIYGGDNSIDIQAIDRPDVSYDFIVCSHIIEHVPDHRKAIKELTRVLSLDGLMVLAYPTPATRAVTVDWGKPDPAQHGHYRLIGRDFEAEYKTVIPDAFVLSTRGIDPVTGDDDIIYLVTKNSWWVKRALESGLDCSIVAP